MAEYRYNGMGGSNTNKDNYKVFNVGQWVICKDSEKGQLKTDTYAFVGYIVHVGEWNSKVQFVNCLHKVTGKVEKVGRFDGKSFVIKPEGFEILLPNAELEHYAPDDDVQRMAMRALIHSLQLKALDNNDRETFFALGAMIDEA